MQLSELTLTQITRLLRNRDLLAEELVEALLGRIDSLEPSIQAWEFVDREGAMAAARRADQAADETAQGLLHGAPLGIKDIFFTAGLPTASGSPSFKDFVPAEDATAVARVRDAGAIVLGKTVTVQWAFADPPRTRNPWNLDRTPGGSSSGSAAAVAARMVPAALGSQTGGSILRPAAFCGIVGLKPTYGRVSRYGVTPSGWSIDHAGPLTRTVEDAALLLQVMAGHDPKDESSLDHPVGNYLEATRAVDGIPRLGLVTDYLEAANPEVAAHIRGVATRFERAGASIREVRLPASLSTLVAIRHLINQVETAELHGSTLARHPEGYAPRITALAKVGQLVPAPVYVHAQRLRRHIRPHAGAMLRDLDCLVMPTVDGVAPGPSTTGSSAFQAVWSLFGFPAISLPSGLSGEGLPLGTQLVARPLDEERLLKVAAWCEAVLGPMPAPTLP